MDYFVNFVFKNIRFVSNNLLNTGTDCNKFVFNIFMLNRFIIFLIH